MRYALLLRGVNVGRNKRVGMADLRRLMAELGYAEVRTYLQSGNIVVTAGDEAPEKMAARVEEALGTELKLVSKVLARTGPELAAVVADNPFPDALAIPKLLHVTFLSADPDLSTVDPKSYLPDEFRVADRAIYLRYAVSPLESRLAGLIGKLPLTNTTRNWNTVEALARLTTVHDG
jgi:uncharacterized protein (DUF1697 family)